MHVEHIVFLIHPCCYEPINPEQIRRDNQQLFLDREEQVKERWLAEIAQRDANTLFVQLGGPAYLREAAATALGEARALSLKTPFPDSQDLDQYYRGLAAEIRAHLEAHELLLDTARVTSELWGESFEGCVPGYGGAFAQYLGLTQTPRMRFEMTVYDTRFLYLARRCETLAIADSDVEAWLFECHDGTSVVTFQPRRTAQWLDERRVHLPLNDRRHQVCDKLGHTVWPSAPWTKDRQESVHEYSLALKEFIMRWVRCVGMGIDDFRAIVEATRIE